MSVYEWEEKVERLQSERDRWHKLANETEARAEQLEAALRDIAEGEPSTQRLVPFSASELRSIARRALELNNNGDADD